MGVELVDNGMVWQGKKGTLIDDEMGLDRVKDVMGVIYAILH